MINIDDTHTEKDFETMMWHNNRLHALMLPNENSELKLDIDHIFKADHSIIHDPKYWISPCDLIFYDVSHLIIDIEFNNELPLVIKEIKRSNSRPFKTSNMMLWDYIIEFDKGYIAFSAPEYRQEAKAQAILLDTPYLPANSRRSDKIDFRLLMMEESRGGLVMSLVPHFVDELLNEKETLCIDEDAFGFIEPLIKKSWPKYEDFGHWGQSNIPINVWQDIIVLLNELRHRLLMAKSAHEVVGLGFLFDDIRIDFYRNFNRMSQQLANMIESLVLWLQDKCARCLLIAIHGV